MTHFDHQDEQDFVPDVIDNAAFLPRPKMHAIELFLSFHLLESMRAGIFFQAEDVPVHLLADVSIELADLPLSGGRDFNAVGQPLVSKLPHEVTERNGALLFGLFQGSAGVRDVLAVQLLRCQQFE
jgi:hypothetical protein